MAKVKVKAETKATISLFLNDRELSLTNDGSSELDVDLDRNQQLTWTVVGTPSAAYKIAVTPVDRSEEVKVIAGVNPVVSRIPGGQNRGGGRMEWKLQRKTFA